MRPTNRRHVSLTVVVAASLLATTTSRSEQAQTGFRRTESGSISVGDQQAHFNEEFTVTDGDGKWRLVGAVALGGGAVLRIEMLSTPAPLSQQWTLCFLEAEPPLCIETTLLVPDISESTVGRGVSSVKPHTPSTFSVAIGQHEVYRADRNIQYRLFGSLQDIDLEIPEHLGQALASQIASSLDGVATLNWLGAIHDEAARTNNYDDVPFVKAAVALEIARAVVRQGAAFDDNLHRTMTAVSPEEIEVAMNEASYEPWSATLTE